MVNPCYFPFKYRYSLELHTLVRMKAFISGANYNIQLGG